MVQRALVVLKSDALERGLAAQIVGRYEAAGLLVERFRLVRSVDRSLASRHYPDGMAEALGLKAREAGRDVKDLVGEGFRVLGWCRDYLAGGPAMALVLSGDDAVSRVRSITGNTDPVRADKGTVRGDFGRDSMLKANIEGRAVRNLVHASGTLDEARREIRLWFPR
jgi:nucleoside-diphosphate kinase